MRKAVPEEHFVGEASFVTDGAHAVSSLRPETPDDAHPSADDYAQDDTPGTNRAPGSPLTFITSKEVAQGVNSIPLETPLSSYEPLEVDRHDELKIIRRDVTCSAEVPVRLPKVALKSYMSSISKRWPYICKDNGDNTLIPELMRLLISMRVSSKKQPTSSEEEREVLAYLIVTRSGFGALRLFENHAVFATWLRALKATELERLVNGADAISQRATYIDNLLPVKHAHTGAAQSSLPVRPQLDPAYHAALKDVIDLENKQRLLIQRLKKFQ
jgi:hypothetical protein